MRHPSAVLFAAAIAVTAAPARADNVIANLWNGIAVSRTQAVNMAANEKACLAQLKAGLFDAKTEAAVLPAFVHVIDGQLAADRYKARRQELVARADAVVAELDKALALGDDAAAKAAVEAARRKSDAVRLDSVTWRVLPLSIARIDAGKDAEGARHRAVLVQAMRSIADGGDYAAARQSVLDALKSAQ